MSSKAIAEWRFRYVFRMSVGNRVDLLRHRFVEGSAAQLIRR